MLGRSVGNYRVRAQLGEGGMGAIYLAEHLTLGRKVAVKVLRGGLARDADLAGRLFNEARAASAIRHPNIVDVFDCGVLEGGEPYLVMELLEGEDLAQHLGRRGPLPPARVAALLGEACDGLAAAADAGVVHRDLKPANLFLVGTGSAERLKVLDFGIAKLFGDLGSGSVQTRTGALFGTPLYMSPEQCRGVRQLDSRADIYALGVIAYELLTGSPPFVSPGVGEILAMHLSTVPAPPTGVPDALATVVMRALAKRPEDRFASMRELGSALRAALAPAGVGVTQLAPATPPAAPRSPDARTPPSLRLSVPHNLPAALTTFVGRTLELAEAGALLHGARLVTLTGEGGVGKSRLALELAAGAAARHPDGVFLVELAPLTDPELVDRAILAAVAPSIAPGTRPRDALLSALRDKTMLVVLDNCEHLVAACAESCDALLRAAGGVRILATSREALGVGGEAAWRVPSLSLPDADASLAELGEAEAVRLFVGRATLVEPRFALTDENAALVGAVVRRLDGIPLALELCAARLRALSLGELSARLGDRFRLLTGGSRTALPRQQTLRATIDWSHDLLSTDERRLFRALAVFHGGFTLDAVEAVCESGATDVDPTELLAQLVQKSLVTTHDRGGKRRYGWLETVRQYARDRLFDAGEAEPLRTRHVAFYLALAEAADEKMMGPEQVAALDAIGTELENLRAALEWSAPDSAVRLRLARALTWFWQTRGHIAEGRRWFASVIEHLGDRRDLDAAKVWMSSGFLAWVAADLEEARAYLSRAVTICEELGEKPTRTMALAVLGHSRVHARDYDGAKDAAGRALALAREMRDPFLTMRSLGAVGEAHRFAGEDQAAEALYQEALAIATKLGMAEGIGYMKNGLGVLAQRRGAHGEAAGLFAEALARFAPIRSIGGLTYVVGHAAALAVERGRGEDGAFLWGGANRVAGDHDLELTRFEIWHARPVVEAARERIGAERYDAAIERGRKLKVEQLVTEAIAILRAIEREPVAPP